jgi:hypothetical protein
VCGAAGVHVGQGCQIDLTFVLFETKQVFVRVTSWALNKFLDENILGKSTAPLYWRCIKKKPKKTGENDYLFKKRKTFSHEFFFSEWFIEMDHHECTLGGGGKVQALYISAET